MMYWLVLAASAAYGPVDLAEAWRHPPNPDPLHVRDTNGLGGQIALSYTEQFTRWALR